MASVVVSSKGQVVLPKEVRDQLRLARGARLTIEIEDGEIRLSPLRPVPGNWRNWKGVLKNKRALQDHLREHREEVDAER